jgi:hypothetical protein
MGSRPDTLRPSGLPQVGDVIGGRRVVRVVEGYTPTLIKRGYRWTYEAVFTHIAVFTEPYGSADPSR